MPTMNTMVVPCTVNSRLKTWGETTVLPAAASCHRITLASRPAIRKNARPATTYMTPRRLWSTVTTHSWRRASPPVEIVAGAGVAIGGVRTLTAVCPPSAKRHEVGDELVQFVAGDLHRGHQRAGFQRGGVVHPGAEGLRRGRRPPCPPGGAAQWGGEGRAQHGRRGR